MSEFNFNYSPLNEESNLLLTKDFIQAVRTHARILLIPFFRDISIRSLSNEEGKEYPALTELAERIMQSAFDDGELDKESEEEAHQIALSFLAKQNGWQKTCLSFYFCSDESFLDQLEEANENNDLFESIPEEEWDKETGRQVQEAIRELVQNEDELAGYIVKELIHLQDIFSAEDISSWTAGSISFANENFEKYVGKGQVLIPQAIGDIDYWESAMEKKTMRRIGVCNFNIKVKLIHAAHKEFSPLIAKSEKLWE